MQVDSLTLKEEGKGIFSGTLRFKDPSDSISIIASMDGCICPTIEMRQEEQTIRFTVDARRYFDRSSNIESELVVRVYPSAQCLLGGFRFLGNSTRKRKLFFLHIPKTAGSSINTYFSELFVPSVTHIESNRSQQYKNLASSHFSFISGHVRLFECMSHISPLDFVRTTIVRDPFEHLISHINWILHICRDTESDIYRRHPKEIKNLGHQLQKVQFDDPNSVEQFIGSMPAIGHSLFNNCQTRYLLNAPETLILERSHGEQAIESLHFFDFIGAHDDVDGFVDELLQYFDIPRPRPTPRVNSLNNPAKIVHSPDLHSALFPLLHADQILYDHIRQSRKNY